MREKFSKGPWIAKKGSGWFITRPNARMAIEVGMRPNVSLIESDGGEEQECKANAHLMAASPDLFYMVKELNAILYEIAFFNDQSQGKEWFKRADVMSAIDKTDSLIEKALGI